MKTNSLKKAWIVRVAPLAMLALFGAASGIVACVGVEDDDTATADDTVKKGYGNYGYGYANARCGYSTRARCYGYGNYR